MKSPTTLKDHSYTNVIHMDDDAAARQLGKTVLAVRAYRDSNPLMAYRPAPVAIQRPGIVTLRMPVTEPSRSNATTEARVMFVSLPTPPWGGGFERMGVVV